MARNIIALFAGQGVTEQGMARKALDKSPENSAFVQVFASFFSGMNVAAREEGKLPNVEEIAEMEVARQAQPALTHMVTYPINVAMFAAFMELASSEGAKPNLVAASGQSLGMYSAMAAAGVLPFDVGRYFVVQRGLKQDNWQALYRRHVNPFHSFDPDGFSMYALVGIDEYTAGVVANEAGVDITNVNCEGVINIAGEHRNMVNALDFASAWGGRRGS